MEPKQLEEILRNALPTAAEIHAQGENSHYGVIVVSDELVQLSKVKQQQAVYAPLGEYFATNAIHALTIKVFSTEQWKKDRLLNMVS
ncbi:transcriptional regulator [Actinobacillus ureae]|uniref:BolA-like protein n=1 Tax=Actinobacillus ureae ATCC 25976 TaxID=887324 RepID=E8KJN7_9PAST|nr:BolA family protein [Actinobacillus ureae]EFX90893.1 BolA-like protein [Actinobacillus ureae ATCC 25976]SUT87216.1 transcriptional regulator [Actinobacillus ureae]SUU48208.1 transcriptional regulator [Actinobacillus ureae]